MKKQVSKSTKGELLANFGTILVGLAALIVALSFGFPNGFFGGLSVWYIGACWLTGLLFQVAGWVIARGLWRNDEQLKPINNLKTTERPRRFHKMYGRSLASRA
jgi:uncharacterized membrane protein YhdT